MPKTFADEDERHACGISSSAAVNGGAYGGCVEGVVLGKGKTENTK